MAQLSSAIHYLSYFPAAVDMLPLLSSSISMTSLTMIFESQIPQPPMTISFSTNAKSHVFVPLRTTESLNLIREYGVQHFPNNSEIQKSLSYP